MSIINETSAPCSKCGQQHKVVIYRSINISENPEFKERTKDGSIFLWECPHCGQVNLARYETLYHDPAGKLMVWLLPEGDLPESQMQSITMHTKAMGGYVLRRVNDTGSLMEKVLIHDAGLDDAVIEMCKYVTKLEMAAKNARTGCGFHVICLSFLPYRGRRRLKTDYFLLSTQRANDGSECRLERLSGLQRHPRAQSPGPSRRRLHPCGQFLD